MSTVIYHNHHIIPRHAGGTDSPDNLVRLTVEEHIEAHRKLYEEYGRWEDKIAYQALSGIIDNEEVIRQKCIEAGKKGSRIRTATGWKPSEETRKKIGDRTRGKGNGFYGKKHSEETKKKMSESLKGRMSPMQGKKHTEETKQKMREVMTGKKHSTETLKKMSEAHKTRPPTSEETKRKIGKANKGNVPWNKGIKGLKRKKQH